MGIFTQKLKGSYLRTTFPALLTGGLHLFRCMSMFPVGRFDSLGGQTGIVGSCSSPLWDVKPKQTFSFAGPERIGLYCNWVVFKKMKYFSILKLD